jgi:hypothetical protein
MTGKRLAGRLVRLPRRETDYPNRDRLAQRFESFRRAKTGIGPEADVRFDSGKRQLCAPITGRSALPITSLKAIVRSATGCRDFPLVRLDSGDIS